MYRIRKLVQQSWISLQKQIWLKKKKGVEMVKLMMHFPCVWETDRQTDR